MLSALLLTDLLLSQATYAQAGGLEEIVVTARKREESLQDTPISIAAFRGEDLERQHINHLDDIARVTPNLVFNPGATFSGSNASAATYIRGIGQIDFTLTTEPGVGIYLDEVYIGTSIGNVLDLVDVERLEVLRGPQGTLFGRNTIGGAISVTSRKPDETLHGDLKVTTGSYDRIDAKGSVNVPITDTLFANLSMATFNRDGFVSTPNARSGGKLGDMGRNAIRGALRFVPSDRFEANLAGDYSRARENAPPHVRVANFNGASLALIGSLANPASPNYQPPPAPLPPPNFIDLQNIVVGIPFVPFGPDSIYDASPPIVPNPLFGDAAIGPADLVDIQRDSLVNPSTMDLGTKTDIWGLALTWSYDFGPAQLKSITSYREMEAHTAFDAGGVAALYNRLESDFDSDQISQEVQLTGLAFGERLNWLLGFYHFEQDGLDVSEGDFVPVRLLSGSNIDNRSTAGFFQGTFDVTQKLAVTAGIRYTHESKKFIVPDDCLELPLGPATLPDGTVVSCSQLQSIVNPRYINPAFLTAVNAPVFPFDPDPNARLCCLPISDADGNVVALVPGALPGDELLPRGTSKRTFSDGTPYASISYRWTEDLMTYFSYSEGFKSGGFVQRIFPPKSEVPSFNPETVKVFEVGLKWSGLDNRVQASAAGFHTQYDDLQVQINDGIAPVTRNAAAAEINGFELEVTALPAAGWLVQGGVGYLDASYTELDPRENFSTDLFNVTLDTKLPNAPEWSTNLGVQYAYEVPNFGGRLIGRLDWSYRTETYHDALNFPEIRQPSLHLLDLALTYVSPRERWEVSVFGKNVTDERYIVSGFINGLTQGHGVATVGRPGEWGLNVAYRFGD